MHDICVKISVRNLGEKKRDTQTASSLSFADKPWKGTPHVLEKFENFPSPGMPLCYNTSFSNLHSIINLSSGRLREVKIKRKFQTFSSKSGRGRLREVIAYNRFQIQIYMI